jgi:hypothetical protein
MQRCIIMACSLLTATMCCYVAIAYMSQHKPLLSLLPPAHHVLLLPAVADATVMPLVRQQLLLL